ncbi:MAG: hypothetical protein HYU64_01065 [Armatimonadetes bacterium]|nr:hypothetical protein [Armatimonadota bacterium]
MSAISSGLPSLSGFPAVAGVSKSLSEKTTSIDKQKAVDLVLTGGAAASALGSALSSGLNPSLSPVAPNALGTGMVIFGAAFGVHQLVRLSESDGYRNSGYDAWSNVFGALAGASFVFGGISVLSGNLGSITNAGIAATGFLASKAVVSAMKPKEERY